MINLSRNLIRDIQDSVADDNIRMKIQFLWLYRLLAVVSFGMTIVNILTKNGALGWSTLLFGTVCVINIALTKAGSWKRVFAEWMFMLELLILFSYYLVAGTAEGFSPSWICILPFGVLLLYGRRKGSYLCGAMFLIIVFFLWIPAGEKLLLFPYTESFKLRFPLLYMSIYAIALFIETLRIMTQNRLLTMTNQYHHYYLHDSLTEVYNRYGFHEVAATMLAEIPAHGLALIILDIDYFKHVNDRYGHSAGDEVLRQIARCLEETVNGDGIVCRLGGEEFAVLPHDANRAETLAHVLRSRIEVLDIPFDQDTIRVTASIGVASMRPETNPDISTLMRHADDAMYRAKRNGKNRVEVIHIGPFGGPSI